MLRWLVLFCFASVAFAQEVFYLNSESFGTYSRSIMEKLVENRTDEKVAKAIYVGALINGDAKMFSPGTKVKVLERDPQNFWAKVQLPDQGNAEIYVDAHALSETAPK